MPTLIHMPQVSANLTSAVLKEWFKQEGDAVAANDPLGGVETDKVLIDFEAEHAGTLAKILVAPGTDVAVGAPIAVISKDGESAADVAAFLASVATPTVSAAAAATATAPAPGRSPGEAGPQSGQRIIASPLARRLARDAGIDLSGVKGSGPRGRIVKRDLEGLQAASPAPAADAHYTDTPHSAMRRTIARRLAESKSTVPHFYVKLECQVQKLIALRAEINQAAPRKVSLNDFIIKAVATALKEVPDMNVSWDDNHLRRYHRADISVAVSTDGGLITPIVRAAEEKSISRISADIADLAARARSGGLSPHEYQGGSFTVSNLGMYDVAEFSAIINPPQAAILAVGAAQERPVVVDGALTAAPVMNMVLSVDHRAVDGALAATFAATLKRLIENPLTLLI
ncbi:dihydrolipoamide acetyltransferase family protein [Pseudoduganella sp. OTU4001]|uniref:dihydrolipoamide acetyltransferase family protein n=1 Tax=Pseudoduganella sp. OTU4001 TaxID=3043854 RepID=UPI00313CE579